MQAADPSYFESHPLVPFDLEASLETTGLRLVRPNDVEVLFSQIYGATEVLRWLCWSGPEDLERLERRYVPPFFGQSGTTFGVMLAVVDEARGVPIGEVSLTFERSLESCELGYWLSPDAQGEGHGNRLVELAVGLAIERIGCQSVTASVMEGNDRSLRVLRRAGFDLRRIPETPGRRADGIAWIATATACSRRT